MKLVNNPEELSHARTGSDHRLKSIELVYVAPCLPRAAVSYNHYRSPLFSPSSIAQHECQYISPTECHSSSRVPVSRSSSCVMRVSSISPYSLTSTQIFFDQLRCSSRGWAPFMNVCPLIVVNKWCCSSIYLWYHHDPRERNRSHLAPGKCDDYFPISGHSLYNYYQFPALRSLVVECDTGV